MASDTLGYSPAVAAYIEGRLTNRVETPNELLADVGKALTRSHGLAAYEYEERYIEIHFSTRLCPNCGDVVRLRVVVNRDTRERTRECPECGVVGTDEHVDAERRVMLFDRRARRGGLRR